MKIFIISVFFVLAVTVIALPTTNQPKKQISKGELQDNKTLSKDLLKSNNQENLRREVKANNNSDDTNSLAKRDEELKEDNLRLTSSVAQPDGQSMQKMIDKEELISKLKNNTNKNGTNEAKDVSTTESGLSSKGIDLQKLERELKIYNLRLTDKGNVEQDNGKSLFQTREGHKLQSELKNNDNLISKGKGKNAGNIEKSILKAIKSHQLQKELNKYNLRLKNDGNIAQNTNNGSLELNNKVQA